MQGGLRREGGRGVRGGRPLSTPGGSGGNSLAESIFRVRGPGRSPQRMEKPGLRQETVPLQARKPQG